MKILVSLMMLLFSLTPQGEDIRPVLAMKTGVLFRMHVIAQDDTPAMQALKLAVRDEVRRTYAAAPAQGATMLAQAQAMLPQLRTAALRAAKQHGFDGDVTVTVEDAVFDERTLDGHTFPAGRYPALIIRLGEAQGRNWWGLIDPEAALTCAGAGDAAGMTWDWGWRAFFRALWPKAFREVPACE